MASEPLEALRSAFVQRKAQRKADPPSDEALAASLPAYRAQNDENARRTVPVPPGVTVEERVIGGRRGEYYRVEGSRKDRLILYLHGGGWENGSVTSRRYTAMGLARAANADCFSAGYTQWPEGRFPQGLADCLSVYAALRAQCPGSLVLAGESAGGTLVLSVTLALKAQGLPLPAALAVYCPVTDLEDRFPSRRTRDALDPMICPDVGRRMLAHFCGGTGARDPLRCVRYGDYAGFPPAFIGVGSDEVLLDDAADLHRLLDENGARNRLAVYDGLYHAFMMFPSPEAEQCFRDTAAFLDGS